MKTDVLGIYRRLQAMPLGGRLFNVVVGLKAPFFRSIKPNITRLEPSMCQVEMKDRWGVRNHIGTVNAVAMCTLAELTAGLALDATIPSHLRWIPRGMTVQYLAKGKGTLLATCEFDPDIIVEGDIEISVVLTNREGQEVFTAGITMYISRRKS